MEGREGSGGHSGEPGVLGSEAEDWRPFRRPGGVTRPSRRAGRGLEALPVGREEWGGVRVLSGWLGGLEALLKEEGRVGRPSRRAERV